MHKFNYVPSYIKVKTQTINLEFAVKKNYKSEMKILACFTTALDKCGYLSLRSIIESQFGIGKRYFIIEPIRRQHINYPYRNENNDQSCIQSTKDRM